MFNFSHGIVVRLKKVSHKIRLRYYAVFVYLPPEGSPRYTDEKNGVEILKDVIFETKAKYGHFYIAIVGDVNSRIGNEQDFILDDDIRFSQNMDYYPVDLFKRRNS